VDEKLKGKQAYEGTSEQILNPLTEDV